MLLYGPHSPSYVQWGPVEEAELLGDFWGVGAYRALRGSPNTGDPPTLPHGGRDGGDINGGGGRRAADWGEFLQKWAMGGTHRRAARGTEPPAAGGRTAWRGERLGAAARP